jgi:hypothetical protein
VFDLVLNQVHDDSFSDAGIVTEAEDVRRCVSRDGTVWCSQPLHAGTKAPPHNILRTPAGPIGAATNPELSICETFSLFIDDEVINMIVSYTNERMRTDPASADRVWKNTDGVEIRAFIGLLLIFGVLQCRKEPLHEIWSEDSVTNRPIFNMTMPRKRFVELHRHITFDDFSTRNVRQILDKLAPIREVSNLITSRYRQFYAPNALLTIDEQLVGFRGSCPGRVYMKVICNKN